MKAGFKLGEDIQRNDVSAGKHLEQLARKGLAAAADFQNAERAAARCGAQHMMLCRRWESPEGEMVARAPIREAAVLKLQLVCKSGVVRIPRADEPGKVGSPVALNDGAAEKERQLANSFEERPTESSCNVGEVLANAELMQGEFPGLRLNVGEQLDDAVLVGLVKQPSDD